MSLTKTEMWNYQGNTVQTYPFRPRKNSEKCTRTSLRPFCRKIQIPFFFFFSAHCSSLECGKWDPFPCNYFNFAWVVTGGCSFRCLFLFLSPKRENHQKSNNKEVNISPLAIQPISWIIPPKWAAGVRLFPEGVTWRNDRGIVGCEKLTFVAWPGRTEWNGWEIL